MASRPAEGDDQDRRRQRRTEVEQVLLQHPDIVQAFVVGIPEIVAAAPRLATAGAVPPCEKQTAPQPLRRKATIAAASPPDRVKLGFLRHPARPGRVVRILGLSGDWEITAKSRGSLIRRINSLMTRFSSLLGQK
jgi:hypothetical protein